uniref:Receptor-like serine/threonine-protein kinase n=1 Tax=Fagus sylvatica TaxID=28930 RepID=A0A2N9G4Q8_FAGSY
MVCKLHVHLLHTTACASFHVYCAAKHSLKFGESIKEDNGETLVSAGGEFELGFFTPNGSSGHKRYVGIWYTRDKQTVVWVANRDHPLINATGAFGFANHSYIQVWDTSSGNSYWSPEDYWCDYCTYQAVNLTDSGNLMVYNEVSQMASWESFEHPTDTFLPGMSMDSNLILTSWRDRDDPGRGNFTFRADLVEDKKTLIIEKEGMIYWKIVNYGQVPLSNKMYFSALSENDIARLVMHFSGKLEYWGQNSIGTPSLMQAEPSNNCSVYNFCGKFGSCNPNNKLACKCLPGFMPNVPQKWHSGRFFRWVRQKFEVLWRQRHLLELKDDGSRGKPRSKDLVNLQEEHPDGNNLFVRVAISDIEQTVRNCNPCGTNMIPYPLSTSSNCGDPMYFSFYCNTTSGEFNEEDEKGIDVPFYDLESILVATDNFSNENKLGQGGYGPVFKGKLPSGQEIAVKRLSSVSSQGLQEFKNEVVLIAKLQHRNLVRLYGYCIKGNEKILLYDGYMSPEYALDGIFSIKSDVFSFGVVLLEIISGRKNTGFYQSEQAMSLLGYAWRLWTDNKILDLMDETLRDTCIADQFVKCINIGLLCVQDDPSDRPTMSNVIKMLDSETTNLPTPKQPAFCITRDQSSSTSSNRPESNNDITNSLDGR